MVKYFVANHDLCGLFLYKNTQPSTSNIANNNTMIVIEATQHQQEITHQL